MEAPLPDTFGGALRWFIAGVIIFALGFESIVMLWEGKVLFSGASLLLARFLLAIVVYWTAIPVAALVGLAAVAVCPVAAYLTIKVCKRYRPKPQMLITLGLSLVFAALVFAAIGITLVGYAYVTLPPQTAVVRPDGASPSPPEQRPAPDPRIEVAGGPYFPDEVRTMVAALNKLNEILNKKAMPIVQTAQVPERGWNVRPGEETDALIKRLAALQVQIVDVEKDVEGVIADNSNYRGEIEPVIRNEKNSAHGLVAIIGDVSDMVRELQTTPQLFRFYAKEATRFSNAVRDYDSWIDTASMRLRGKTERLRNYKSP